MLNIKLEEKSFKMRFKALPVKIQRSKNRQGRSTMCSPRGQIGLKDRRGYIKRSMKIKWVSCVLTRPIRLKVLIQHNIDHTDKFWTLKCLSYRSSPPEVFLGEGVLKIWKKCAGAHPCRSVISINLLYSFMKITFWHGCSSVNLMYIFRTHFLKNSSGGLLLKS